MAFCTSTRSFFNLKLSGETAPPLHQPKKKPVTLFLNPRFAPPLLSSCNQCFRANSVTFSNPSTPRHGFSVKAYKLNKPFSDFCFSLRFWVVELILIFLCNFLLDFFVCRLDHSQIILQGMMMLSRLFLKQPNRRNFLGRLWFFRTSLDQIFHTSVCFSYALSNVNVLIIMKWGLSPLALTNWLNPRMRSFFSFNSS